MKRFYDLLDEQVFPRIIAYTTHRLHITALMLLWLGLLVGGGATAFELVGGNYTNGLSALASCIVLLQQISHHRHVRSSLNELHAKVDAQQRRRDPRTGRYVKRQMEDC
jgi:hypothetical protein